MLPAEPGRQPADVAQSYPYNQDLPANHVADGAPVWLNMAAEGSIFAGRDLIVGRVGLEPTTNGL